MCYILFSKLNQQPSSLSATVLPQKRHDLLRTVVFFVFRDGLDLISHKACYFTVNSLYEYDYLILCRAEKISGRRLVVLNMPRHDLLIGESLFISTPLGWSSSSIDQRKIPMQLIIMCVGTARVGGLSYLRIYVKHAEVAPGVSEGGLALMTGKQD